jgi:predicted nucleic acid-binding protein
LWLRGSAGIVPIGLTDLSLCEILQGIREDQAFQTTLEDLRLFRIFDTGGADLAVAAARNFRILRDRGYTVRKTIDCLVATLCIRDRYTLLHRDRDFDPFEKFLGLSVFHP